jgi:lysozyme
MRHISPVGLNLIKAFESFSPVVYVCPAGYPTILWGHVVRTGETFDEPASVELGEVVLRKDLAQAELSVMRLIGVPLEDAQFDALVSLTFNIGGGALQRSTLRSKLNREEYEEVPDEFLKWVWGGGRKLPGLINRRRLEADLFSSAL